MNVIGAVSCCSSIKRRVEKPLKTTAQCSFIDWDGLFFGTSDLGPSAEIR